MDGLMIGGNSERISEHFQKIGNNVVEYRLKEGYGGYEIENCSYGTIGFNGGQVRFADGRFDSVTIGNTCHTLIKERKNGEMVGSLQSFCIDELARALHMTKSELGRQVVGLQHVMKGSPVLSLVYSDFIKLQ